MTVPASPSTNGANGTTPPRGPGGKFAAGNKGGPGNPHAARVARLRTALLDAVTPADMKAIVAKLVEQAKAGNVPAAKEVLERTLGKPVEADLMERIESLEHLLAKENER
jgi:hypothetical protein